MKRYLLIILLAVIINPVMPFVSAQERQAISITPALFQNSVEPGDVWKSYVKVVNSNPYDLTVYVEVVNFEPEGEEGHGRFRPLVNDEVDQTSLAGWITVAKDPITIPPEQSYEIPFTVEVPVGASPGGHFAAILIGTKPGSENAGRLSVQTAQVVTSLFFVRVGGEVVESGDIREFSIERVFNGSPNANFILRFENKGNVHLQPQGDITIFNMWGKERGFIPINQKTNFGNVLPESIRKFEFTWTGESSLSDIGRYKAVVTLAYGDDGRKFVSRTVYFYVIPVKGTLITLGVLVAFIAFVMLMMRLYIRRAISLAGYEEIPKTKRRVATAATAARTSVPEREHKAVRLESAPSRRRVGSLSAPIRAGVIDLRTRLHEEGSSGGRFKGALSFIGAYRLFFISIFVLLLSAVGGGLYLADVLSTQKSYEITIDKPDGQVTISSEEVIKERLSETDGVPDDAEPAASTQAYDLLLVNASEVPGTAAELALRLESMGYRVDSISSEVDRNQERTVIVYDEELADVAVTLSEQLGNALVSSFTDESASSTEHNPQIRIIIGRDQAE